VNKLILISSLIVLTGCFGTAPAAQICNATSDSRCVGEHVGSECTSNRSHTCIKTGGGTLTPTCDCLDSQGDPVPAGWGEVDRAGRVMIDAEGNSIPVDEREFPQ
jgi:hypothetical protein